MTKKSVKPYSAMNKAELVRALTQRDRTIAKLEKRVDELDRVEQPPLKPRLVLEVERPATTLPRNPMPWECS